MTLQEYLNADGKGATSRLAKAIGAHIPDVSDWARGHRPVPITRCVAIEQATGGQISRRDLRPDDWQLFWPELGK